ncbi:MAG: hypothetical protein ACFCU9_09585 [Cyanophyceae cyanobacterium]
MGTHYLMTPLDEEDLGKWSIAAELFLEEAARKWPESIVRTSEKSELCSATVEIPVVGNRSISLSLLSVKRTKTNQLLSTDTGSHYEAAEIAVWFRKLVPCEHKLYLATSNLSMQLELPFDVTPDRIIASVKKLIAEDWGFAWQAFENCNLGITVIAGRDSTYSESIEKLIENITRQWPSTESTFLLDPAGKYNLYRLEISSENSNQFIIIYLFANRRYITVSGDSVLCSQFALWYRRHVPSKHKISLRVTSIDRSRTVGISLTGDTTGQEIVEAIL